uniref:Uncharacterized protein n=1 Tax=Timema douglasi TaxID=61478 RepID=A0A7R8VJ02_TIMDO|nr:unnamed protein product [Timema douglasi]
MALHPQEISSVTVSKLQQLKFTQLSLHEKGGGASDASIFIVDVTNLESFLQRRDTVNGYIVCWDAAPYIVPNLIRMEESRKDDKHKNIKRRTTEEGGQKERINKKNSLTEESMICQHHNFHQMAVYSKLNMLRKLWKIAGN